MTTTLSQPTLSQPQAMPDIPSPGSIVKVRGREWVTLPQSRVEKQDQVLRLGPWAAVIRRSPPCSGLWKASK